ncbi:MAG: NADH-quinone oxidoreductase subunit NuoE family protein [Planctomycetota bacterium]|jgi:NADH-quinone oxidoreductase subunit E
MKIKSKEIREAIGSNTKKMGGLITVLQNIQTKYGYLPEKALRAVSKKTGWPLLDIYGVTTFYTAFDLNPRGKHLVSVCLGTACHVRGAHLVVEEFERQLDIKAGQTTGDKEFTLKTVNCLGACALGPIVVVDGKYFSKVTPPKVKKILKTAKDGKESYKPELDESLIPVTVGCPKCNHSMMDIEHMLDGHPSVRVTVSYNSRHEVLRLSSLYGSNNIESENEIPTEEIVNFFCPHCHSELTAPTDCEDCGAPFISMIVRGGGVLQVCSRRGCPNHMLDLDGVNF